MNGGIAHAIEVAGPSSAKDAADGYRLMVPPISSMKRSRLPLRVFVDNRQFDSLDLDDQTS